MKTLIHTLASGSLVALVLTVVPVRQGPQDAPADPGIPVGAVIPWWGNVQQIPPGFEVCDGRFPETRGAALTDPKPDLRDRFPKGTERPRDFRPRMARTGGSNTNSATTGGHQLTVAEIPSKLRLANNADGVTDPEHRHEVDRSLTTALVDTDASGDEVRVPVWPDVPGGDSPVATESKATGLAVDPSEIVFDPTATVASHTHPIDFDFDNQPAFQEVLFIIRVK